MFRCIFDRIGDDIHINLPQAQRVAPERFTDDVRSIELQRMMLCVCERTNHDHQLMKLIRKLKLFIGKHRLSGIDTCHIQNFIDQFQKMCTGRLNLIQGVCHL